MRRIWVMVPLLVMSAAAQTNPKLQVADVSIHQNPEHTKRPEELGLFFGNGLGLAFRTRSNGTQAPLSMQGSVVTQGRNEAYRAVVDKNNRLIFAYSLRVEKPAADVLNVELRPIDMDELRRTQFFSTIQTQEPAPTLAVSRRFPALRLGDTVEVDILYHPVTGEKIADVLRVITEGSAGPAKTDRAAERFSWDQVKVTIDGKIVAQRPRSWMIGSAIKMRVPGYGEYYLVLSPTTEFPFEASGWVDGNILRFKAANRSVEVIGKTRLLRLAERGTIWVYHVPETRERLAALAQLRQEVARQQQIYAAEHPKLIQLKKELAAAEAVDFSCADNMNQLLGRE